MLDAVYGGVEPGSVCLSCKLLVIVGLLRVVG